MLALLVSCLGIIITIFFVIGTHESAHFLAARLLGIKVLRFSIGFGKTLFRYTDKKGTEYRIALVPLGGYVKMLDESEAPVSADEQVFAFNKQPFYKKAIVILAGPLCNIGCAFILYWLLFVIGFVTITPVTGDIRPRSIAAEAGLTSNQEILRIDNKITTDWSAILFDLLIHAGNQDHVKMDVKNLGTQQTETRLLDLSNWHLDNLTPDLLGSLGIKPYEPAVPLVIGRIRPHSPAARSPLRLGDRLMAIDQAPLKTWDQLTMRVLHHPNAVVYITLERNHHVLTLPVTIGYQRNLFFKKTGFLGISPNFKWPPALLKHVQYSWPDALPAAWHKIAAFTYVNFLTIEKLLTGKLSLQSLGGPLAIFEGAGEALNSGLLTFINFLAFLSISVGIINLLPIPGLDGGLFFLQVIECIIHQSLPDAFLQVLYRLGFLFVIFILVQALMNDILRLYSQ